MEVNNFEALKELIVVDQTKQRLPVKMKEHLINDLPKIKNVDILVSKLDAYDAARRDVKAIKKSSYNVEDKSYNLNKRKKLQIKCFKYNNHGHVDLQCNNGNSGEINSFSQQASRNYRSQNSQFTNQKETNCTVTKSKNNAKICRILIERKMFLKLR